MNNDIKNNLGANPNNSFDLPSSSEQQISNGKLRPSKGSKSLDANLFSKGLYDLALATNFAGGRIIESFKSLIQTGKNEINFLKHIFIHQKLPDKFPSLTQQLLKTGILNEISGSFSNNFKEYPTQIKNAYETAKSAITYNIKKDFLTHLAGAISATNALLVSHGWLESKISPAEGDETITREGLKGRDKYATIDKKFVANDGTELGKETVLRIDTITQRKDSLNSKIEFLNNKLISGEVTDSKELKHINQQLNEAKNQLEVCNNKKYNWMGSNDSREILKGNDIENDRKNNISVAVNQRTQNITTILPYSNEEKTLSMQRFGAIWDPRNGLLNLKELKSYSSGLKDPSSSQDVSAKIDARVAELEGLKKKYKSNDQLFIIDESIRTLDAFRPDSGSLEKQTSIINDRKNFLRNQALEPIKLQLQNNSHMIKSDENGNEIFRMMHVGLLNQNAKNDFQESGWAHIESNQILDMQAAFESIDNLVIKVREEPGTFFDEDIEGNAILYVSAKEIGWKRENPPAELKLETCFMNLSVQGHTTNDGIQAEINKTEMVKLGSWLPQNKEILAKYNDLKTRLENKKESSFELAADIALLASSVSAMSEGCLSCKDRGGTVAEIIAIKSMESNLIEFQKTRNIDHNKALKYIDKAMQKFSNEIFDENGPTVKVVNDCTGVTVVKVDFTELTRMDVMNRAYELGRVGFAAISGGLEVTRQEEGELPPTL
ncbi:MAG: hypothetical protein H0W50_05430 [Parachlamydiaceae bacterium]|nr:hypothetical protein [Parachlamydiaceae bacterium]